MKVIKILTIYNIQNNFTGICQTKTRIFYFKNGEHHNKNGSAIQHLSDTKNWWYYKGKYYGANDFTNKTWKKKVKRLNLEEKLRIFK